MAKKTDLNDQVKIRGIRRRWLLNSIGVVLLILALALGSFFAALWNYYYSSAANDLTGRASSAAGSFRSYTRSQFWAAAQQAVSSYEEKNNLELQFLDATGAVVYSGNDLTTGTTPDTEDIRGALENQITTHWMGRDPSTKWSIRG